MKGPYITSDLILNSDGSIFHLHLKPEQIADDIIIVGDPGRVTMVSSKFESIEHKVSSREFVTHTGFYKGKRLSVISSGIGTDNIDIVINELDSLVNIDLDRRMEKEDKRSLNLVRIGTSGGLQKDIEPGSFVLSSRAIGFDSLLNFYSGSETVNDKELSNALRKHLPWKSSMADPYVVNASRELNRKLESSKHEGDKPESSTLESGKLISGLSISAPGFYGPQGRVLRLEPAMGGLNEAITSFSYKGERIMNYEMESSAIFSLGQMLGHNTATLCAVIANRITGEYIVDYKPVIEELIIYVLDKLTGQE